MKVKLDPGAFAPTRAHGTDAGLDIYSPVDTRVPANGSAVINTGVHAQIPGNCVGILASKSGLNINHGITSRGIIDEGYSGAITVRLDNSSADDYQIRRGDKITQLLIIPCEYVGIEIVDEIESGTRGANGFGSTGR